MSMMGTAVSGMLGGHELAFEHFAERLQRQHHRLQERRDGVLDARRSGRRRRRSLGGVTASLRSLNSLQGSVVGTSTTTDLAIQGEGYLRRVRCERRPLSHQERLLRARRVRQSGQFGRLLLDGQHGRKRPGGCGSHPKSQRHRVGRLADGDDRRHPVGEPSLGFVHGRTPPTCPRSTPTWRPWPTPPRPRSSPTTTWAAHTRSMSI